MQTQTSGSKGSLSSPVRPLERLVLQELFLPAGCPRPLPTGWHPVSETGGARPKYGGDEATALGTCRSCL